MKEVCDSVSVLLIPDDTAVLHVEAISYTLLITSDRSSVKTWNLETIISKGKFHKIDPFFWIIARIILISGMKPVLCIGSRL